MQNSKEQQGEIRDIPQGSMQRNRGKQQNGRLEISSRKLGLPRERAETGTIKDRNGMDLTEAEVIKKRWQEYTEEQYKKDLLDPDNHHDGVITQSQTSWNAK